VPISSLGAGRWYHYNRKNHPVGISYEEISRKEKKKFRPISMLRKEIRLFNGKIGCGTCHNIYSKEPYMLVIDNEGSRLCLECHNK
jgi:predicted CXXCH cytochrome family protein